MFGPVPLPAASGPVDADDLVAALAAQEMTVVDQIELQTGPVAASGTRSVPAGPPPATAELAHGEGLQNYMNDAPVDVGIVRGTSAPRPLEGKPIPITGTVLFLDHNWNSQWSSAVGYSSTDIDNLEGQADDAYKSGKYALGNLLYSPVPGVMIGGELQWGKREMFRDPYVGEGLKVQVSFKYNFSATIGGK